MKLWFVGMFGPGSLTDLREMWDPIKAHFDGMSCVYHGEYGDEEAAYLEQNKGAGAVIYLPYARRHDTARNVALHFGPIQEGDAVMQCDTLERIQSEFITGFVKPHLASGKASIVDMVYYFGKPILFMYSEGLLYSGSPHEGLQRTDWVSHPIELSSACPDESRVRLNVRPLRRPDPFHFVNHFAKYWLFPFGSNHAALGLDHFPGGATQATFQAREAKRLEFRREMQRRGYPLTMDGLKTMLSGPLDDVLKDHLRAEKVLSDYWHHTIHSRDVKPGHNPADALPID